MKKMKKNKATKATSKQATRRRTTKRKGRDARGRFADGNPGGPGRPRRAVEREYLAAISDAVPIQLWRGIVLNVVGCAEDGERWAIDLLAKYLLGEPQGVSMTLTELAAREALGIDADRELEAEADRVKNPDSRLFALPGDREKTVLDRALKLAEDEKKSQALERVEAEPELQPYREMLEEGVEWNDDDRAGYWEWVATAPVDVILEWANENADDENADDAATRGSAERADAVQKQIEQLQARLGISG